MIFLICFKLKDKRLLFLLLYKRWNHANLLQKSHLSNHQLKKWEKMTKTFLHQSTQINLSSAQWKIAWLLLKRTFNKTMTKTLLKKLGVVKEEDKSRSKRKTWAICTCKKLSKILQRRALINLLMVKSHWQSLLSKEWEILKIKRTKRTKRILRPLIESLQLKF